MDIITDEEFANKLLNEIDHLKYGLKYFIDKSERLEKDLEYYKNAYENRVNESLKGDK